MATAWYQAIHASKRYRLGTRKTDSSNNVYVYMKGVASLAAGDAVQYDESFAPTRLLNSSSAAGPVAVAMAANTSATNYSWFQIYGIGSVTSGTVAADKQLQATGTAGTVDDTTVAGDTILGMFSMAADSGGAVQVMLNYPWFEAVAIV